MNNTYAGSSIPQMPSTAVPQGVRTLDGLSHRLAESVKRAIELRDRARSIADDVFGGGLVGPSALTFTNNQSGGLYVGGNIAIAKEAQRGRTQNLDDTATELAEVLQSLSVEIDRLTCL